MIDSDTKGGEDRMTLGKVLNTIEHKWNTLDMETKSLVALLMAGVKK